MNESHLARPNQFEEFLRIFWPNYWFFLGRLWKPFFFTSKEWFPSPFSIHLILPQKVKRDLHSQLKFNLL
ncbi:MAG: hypothetical protein A2007_04210 [Verrucomicrobia bacterium GWC2_42_7]|nr:MAG: hypothetical protein A2007_04210 [Verrucomicrobia bacterium GWC2_42_7]